MIFEKREIVRRYAGNPILTPADMPVACHSVFNSGVTRFRGQVLMLLRLEDLDCRQHFRVATSDDGIHFTPRAEPVVLPSDEETAAYEGIIYDPRITALGEDYLITYAAHSDMGVRIGLARTRDFERFERLPFASTVDNRNAVIFPERFGGLYARLERPQTIKDQGDLWISYSPDLVYWGRSKCIARARYQSWDQWKLGAGAPPIATERGWLVIVHGVRRTAQGGIYRLGVLLLDREDPSRVLARSRGSILAPREPYERMGDVPNVVFSCGALLEADGEVRIYYGAADTVMCLATARREDLIEACFHR